MFEMLGIYGYILVVLLGIFLCTIGIYSYKKSTAVLKVLDGCKGETEEETEEVEADRLYNDDKKLLSLAGIVFGIVIVLAGIVGMFNNETEKYIVLLDGNELQIPCSYSDIVDLGYDIDSEDDMYSLSPGEKDWVVVTNSKGQEIELIFRNDNSSDRKAPDCTVIGISVEVEGRADFQLTNGVKIGMTYDEVTDIMGVGSSQYWSEVYTEQVESSQYKISIGYENPVISVGSGAINNSYMDFDSLTYMSTVNLFKRPVTSISVILDD